MDFLRDAHLLGVTSLCRRVAQFHRGVSTPRAFGVTPGSVKF
jgi:hypothetical protein